MSYDGEDNGITVPSNELEYEPVAAQFGNGFAESDDYLSADIKFIRHYHYLAGILEFNLEYTSGDTSLYSITLVNDEGCQTTPNYDACNHLGPISDRIYGRWGHMFLISLK